jgi:2-C-methyl-D-erythritol 4-phosphate cytidylyltransferase
LNRVGLLIAAAGRGERLGYAEPKALVKLGGKTLLQHVLERMMPLASEVIVAITPGEVAMFLEILEDEKYKGVLPIEGGTHRQESIRKALAHFQSSEILMIHDSARPLCPLSVAQRCLHATAAGMGACAALPLADTLVKGEQRHLYGENIARSGVWQVQTPQSFIYSEILKAHLWARENDREFTDDASLYKAWGGKVKLVTGSPLSAKVTTKADLDWLGRFV